MTKAKMIETIQNMEAELWLAYNRYAYFEAPTENGYDGVLDWSFKDNTARAMKSQWSAIHTLMSQIDIECIDNEANRKGSDYHTKLFLKAKEFE